MIVVDTSALVAMLFKEDDAGRCAERLAASTMTSMSVVSYVELGMVTAANRSLPLGELDRWLAGIGVNVTDVSARQGRLALQAFQSYGKGRHPARLNLGDCFAYALAKELEQPLLFKGGDFGLTDIAAA